MTAILKFLGLGVIWVFLLSIPVNGKAVFFPVRSVLVYNPLVEGIDRGLHLALNSIKTYALSKMKDDPAI